MNRFFAIALESVLGFEVEIEQVTPVSGGCINQASRVVTTVGDFFVKWNQDGLALFEEENYGLSLLRKSKTLKVPKVVGSGCIDGKYFLIEQFIESSSYGANFWQSFGYGLADLHKTTNSQYGLDHNNHIGSLVQQNEHSDDWINFFALRRIKPQLGLAETNGYLDSATIHDFELLINQFPQLLADETPSLLHGDLWSGNFMSNASGDPVVFDPAVYFGNREIEIAFTHLFGGFDSRFYDAYSEIYPLASGFEQRMEIYNLYPLLVHLNLFGISYLDQIQNVLKRFT
jgi:fructosamine-3-kinase